MDFNSIMKIFLPKDRVFFQLFEEVAEHVYEMGIKLKEMVNEPDADVRANILAQIENLEHEINEIIYFIFNLSAEQISSVDKFWNEKRSTIELSDI